MRKLKKLDPNDPYEKKVLEEIEWRRRDPEGFHNGVRNIIKRAYENACRKIGIPIDTKLDHNLYIATTEDGLVFFTRGDFLVYPGQRTREFLEEMV